MTGPPDAAAGEFLRNILDPEDPPGPPFTHTFRYSEPEAVITKTGWFTYDVNITDGAITFREGWTGIGRRHAESKARRELVKYKASLNRPSWTITL